MKTKIILIALVLFFFGLYAEVISAQTSVTSQIPTCVSCLINKYYLDEQVVAFLQNPSFDVIKKEMPGESTKPLIYWEGVTDDFNFEFKTVSEYSFQNKFFYRGLNIESISFKATSSASSLRCFKQLLTHWELTTNPKDNAKILKKGYFRDLSKTKNGDLLEVGFLDGNNVRVLLIWNVAEKNNPWLAEVQFLSSGNNCKKKCFESKPRVLSRPQVDLNDSYTYWRALGMELTEEDFKTILFNKRAWQIQDNRIGTKDGGYSFLLIKEGKTTKVSKVIYNHGDETTSSPIAHSNKKTGVQVERSFGKNYNLENGLQIYARDPSRPSSTSFFFDIKFNKGYVSAVYVKAEEFESFDNPMTMILKDMLYSTNCFDGNCVDKIGSKYYSDGYLFIGQWREHKPDFGFVYNRDGIAIDIIENRITTEEANARDIARQNQDYESMVTTLEQIDKNRRAVIGNWEGHITSMENYFKHLRNGNTKMIDAMKRAVDYLADCSKNCDVIIEQSRQLSSLYSKYNFCVENKALLNRIEKNAAELKKEVNALLMNMNKANSDREYNEILAGYQKQIETHVNEIKDEYYKIVEQYNACVEAQ